MCTQNSAIFPLFKNRGWGGGGGQGQFGTFPKIDPFWYCQTSLDNVYIVFHIVLYICSGKLDNVSDPSGLTVEGLQEFYDEACLAVLNNK